MITILMYDNRGVGVGGKQKCENGVSNWENC